jgi:hypothetical protein
MPNIWFNGAHVSSTIGTETVRSSKLSTFKRGGERERESAHFLHVGRLHYVACSDSHAKKVRNVLTGQKNISILN